MKIDTKRLTVDIPEDLHKRLKFIALQYNITLTTLINRWIIENILKQDEIDGTKKEL